MTVRRFRCWLLVLTLLAPRGLVAQAETGRVSITVVAGQGPVEAAAVRSGRTAATTDSAGRGTLVLPVGSREIVVTKIGFAQARLTVVVRPGSQAVEIRLEPAAEAIEGIVVSSTRSERRIEDEPVRVEVLAAEEVEEKVMMTPGDIAMMLNETSGLRVQSTSPALGGANVRIQGLRGRYTQILADGLPLYGGQSGSLSMLQIPPLDLGQVEVIKGVASALYGSSALGGVVNLISRRPADQREALLNQTSLGGTDAIVYLAKTVNQRLGYSLLGGLDRQSRADVDRDGWADLPGYRRAVLRPRLSWSDGAGRSLFLTAGTTLEDRAGGTLAERLTPAGTSFPEKLDTRRADVGGIGRLLLAGERLLTVRASAMGQRHVHVFGDVREEDRHATGFGELSLSGTAPMQHWVLGTAVQRETYAARDVQGFDYAFTIPSLFAQDEYSPTDWATLALSARLDHHSEYGSFLNPRLSLLLHPLAWVVRASAGTGYFAPTPFTEQTESVGLSRLLPLGRLEAERARSTSLDIGRVLGPVELNATLFASRVDHPLQARHQGEKLQLANAGRPTRTAGTELLARWHRGPAQLTGTYAFLRSTEDDPDHAGRREVPLTPRHAAGLVGMWEAEEWGRIGVELYYTGRQELEENPYRSTSKPYALTGLLVERRLGSARVFVNAENLLDFRQTRFDPLVLPARSAEGRWTTDAWAPLDGRVVNAGVRYGF
jgi:outer membrane receptor for ferrienterochelin and colicins